MMELVSPLNMRISRREGEEPIRAPFGSEPAPRIAVSGLILALRASLSRRVWWICGMGSREELSPGSDNRAESVCWTLDRSVDVFEGTGVDGSGREGDSGGVRIGVSDTRFPQTQRSKSTSCLGSGTNPHLISPSPSLDMCVT